jgi:methylmalonyl-CoA epimerase
LSILEQASFDHVGIAADSSGMSLDRLVGAPEMLVEMPSGVAVARFGVEGAFELVTPLRGGNPIERFLERRGPGLHHVALRVDEPLDAVLTRLRTEGIEPVGQVEPASDGRPSVFLHPSTTGGVLIELVEGPRPR